MRIETNSVEASSVATSAEPLASLATLQGGAQHSASLYVIFISAIAALGGFLFGFDSGVINGTVTALSQAFQSDSVATGFNVASVLLGCAVGALVAGPLADRYGRKPVMIITALVFAISAWGSGDAQSATAFIFTAFLVVLALARLLCLPLLILPKWHPRIYGDGWPRCSN